MSIVRHPSDLTLEGITSLLNELTEVMQSAEYKEMLRVSEKKTDKIVELKRKRDHACLAVKRGRRLWGHCVFSDRVFSEIPHPTSILSPYLPPPYEDKIFLDPSPPQGRETLRAPHLARPLPSPPQAGEMGRGGRWGCENILSENARWPSKKAGVPAERQY